MRIRKISQSAAIPGKIVNSPSDSTTETYSCNYTKDISAVVSSTEPTGNNRNKVWFKRGKNLFNKMLANAGYYYVDGTSYIGNANWKYIFIKAQPNTTYVASGVSNNNQSIGIAEFDSNGTVITGGFSYKNGSFTTNSNTSFLVVSCRVEDLDTYMLEQGTTATTYEEYVEPEIYTRNNNNVYEKFAIPDLSLKYAEYDVTLSANENVPPYNAFGIYTIPKNELDKYGEIISISAKNSTSAPIPCTWKKNTNGTVSVYVCGWSSISGNKIRVLYLKGIPVTLV